MSLGTSQRYLYLYLASTAPSAPLMQGRQTEAQSDRRETYTTITMGCCTRECGLIAGAVFGAAVAILGGVLIPLGNSIIEKTVEKEAVIESGTTAYDNWVAVGGTVYRQFWLFDLKNPLEVLGYGAIPVVVEKGPYTYRTRYLPKENITFNPNNTVSFLLPSGAIFEPSMSVGPEEDKVTTLNLAVAYNESFDGPYNVFTGKDDISKVGVIDSWRGEKNLSFWDDPYCNMINGTDASSFPPFVDKKKPLYFFSSDICRSVPASFVENLDLLGIEVYRYSLLPDTLAAPTVNPDNQCYCKDRVVTKDCTIAGVLDISSCQGGRPIYISLPHFLYGSPFLHKMVMGLNPSEEHHFTYLDVEPTTGFTLRFAKRIQVNMMYGPSKVITVLKKVKDYTIFPLVWMNETAALDDETADMFKRELFSRVAMLEMIQQALLGTGLAIFVLCLVFYCVLKRRNRNQSKFV
ncbi:Platelet glycoprotein 4 [Collichthys lucidus]|uniref:Platelet glycoprotein 4 n=1 Tax=Collichthys lucidus TaxID=240159 RepID=A0A4U5VQB7_COLLU|nr:Platelet glycoprotein 4 [Collichthys lucidus]